MTAPSPAPTCRQPLDAAAIAHALGARASLFSLEVLTACDSTNSVLAARPLADDSRLQVVFAEQQTAGRGRRGRPWQSWPGDSLTFSVLRRFECGAPAPAGLSLVSGLAVVHALRQFGLQGLQLKWPNDVLVFGDKLAGILVELVADRPRPPAAIIGIGINYAVPPEDFIATLPPGALHPTALATYTPNPPSRNDVAAAVLQQLHVHLERYAREGFTAFRDAWQSFNAFANLPVQITGEHVAQAGVCCGVDDDGALLLERDGQIERVISGDVSLRMVS